MFPLRPIGPEDKMPPARAFGFAIIALAGFILWQLLFPFFGNPFR